MKYYEITGFNSFKEYFQFTTAREFWDSAKNSRYEYAKTRLEKIGDFLVHPVQKTGDFAIRNIRNPLMIVSAAIVAIIVATIIFYPDQFIRTVAQRLPSQMKSLLKFGIYSATQLMIVGVLLRSLGRLDPSGELWKKWSQPGTRSIVPLAIGTQIVKKKP